MTDGFTSRPLDTEKKFLASTGVSAAFVHDLMERCRARSIVLLLDCCYSGAFVAGAKGDEGVHLKEKFEGEGRAILTASNAIEYSWEGDDLSGEGAPSVFTAAIVEGLETGEADRDHDGMVSIEDLYQHVYERVRAAHPGQTPKKWEFGVEHDLFVAKNPRPIEIQAAALPPELQAALESPLPSVRAGIVEDLGRLLQSSSAGLALAAQQALEQLGDDDSRRVSAAAIATLEAQRGPMQPAPEQRAREAEEQRAREAEEQKAREAEEQRAREAEEQRAREAEEQRAREAEEQRAREAEEQRAREAEEQRAREAEEQRAREAEEQRAREAEEQRAREAEEKRAIQSRQWGATPKERDRLEQAARKQYARAEARRYPVSPSALPASALEAPEVGSLDEYLEGLRGRLAGFGYELNADVEYKGQAFPFVAWKTEKLKYFNVNPSMSESLLKTTFFLPVGIASVGIEGIRTYFANCFEYVKAQRKLLQNPGDTTYIPIVVGVGLLHPPVEARLQTLPLRGLVVDGKGCVVDLRRAKVLITKGSPGAMKTPLEKRILSIATPARLVEGG